MLNEVFCAGHEMKNRQELAALASKRAERYHIRSDRRPSKLSSLRAALSKLGKRIRAGQRQVRAGGQAARDMATDPFWDRPLA